MPIASLIVSRFYQLALASLISATVFFFKMNSLKTVPVLSVIVYTRLYIEFIEIWFEVATDLSRFHFREILKLAIRFEKCIFLNR